MGSYLRRKGKDSSLTGNTGQISGLKTGWKRNKGRQIEEK